LSIVNWQLIIDNLKLISMIDVAGLRVLLEQFAAKGNETVLAAVESVDLPSRSCTLDDGGVLIYGVRLQPAMGGTAGILLEPAVGTMALAVRIEGSGGWMLTAANEYKSAQMAFADTLVFNGGDNGLVLIQMLTDRINRLEDLLKSHQHAYIPFPGGAAGQPTATMPATAAVPPNTDLVFANTRRDELENTKIKH
jgi:hypothetical protein